ncbi:MAG: hypothetical protein Unbinned176contig1000_32 [Prokaryotic dsDNA virus sp.]|nr:MAG: hypothetical protein Unbinned176contig1000_32 [Prokaryotic dsDNA virus sp.]|tara:strand:+ start:18980 stop:19549 length:570 start_codon:yes stop_codon:yes gene_type:complete
MTDIKKIYIIIGDMRDVFMGISSQYTNNKYESEDAVQLLMLYFLKMNPTTLQKIYDNDGKKGLMKYGAVALRRSFNSPRSEYYYTYKKHREIEKLGKEDEYINSDSYLYKRNLLDNQNDTWEYFEKIDKALDQMYWYDKEIYKLYYNVDNKETLDTLAKKTGISRNSLFTTIDNVRKKLINNFQDEKES